MKNVVVLLFSIVFCFSGCSGEMAGNSMDSKFKGQFDSVEEFLKFYGLEFEGVEHEFVAFESSEFELAGHIFWPKEYKATVFIVHGYLCHSGLLKNIIGYLTGEGYAVACFDLQGHGLSSGEATAIDDFGQYGEALRGFVDAVRDKVKPPYHVIGHSTGASAVIDCLLEGKGDDFEKVVLVSPLIRSVLWKISEVLHEPYSRFSQKIIRVFRNSSHDKEYLAFARNEDRLAAREVSLRWTKALFEWNDKIAELAPCSTKIKVIQGTEDRIVAWRYNMEFIKEKFVNADIVLIKDGRHELFNESEDLRQQVFSQVSNYLVDK
ncbi:MAG: alpha/beta hydrolase [Planctomycetes bacterium]|nr:alpha/beta hydrolase [Planctomycetota bacterium]